LFALHHRNSRMDKRRLLDTIIRSITLHTYSNILCRDSHMWFRIGGGNWLTFLICMNSLTPWWAVASEFVGNKGSGRKCWGQNLQSFWDSEPSYCKYMTLGIKVNLSRNFPSLDLFDLSEEGRPGWKY